MRNVIPFSIFLILFGVATGFAQDGIPIVLPPVPTEGMPPLLQWVLDTFVAVLTVLLPVLVMALKQRLNVANARDHGAMIDRAVLHGGLLAYSDHIAKIPSTEAIANAVNYVKIAVPDSVIANGATDQHLTNAVTAEVIKLSTVDALPINVPINKPIVPVRSI